MIMLFRKFPNKHLQWRDHMNECIGDFIKVGEIQVSCNIPLGELKELFIRERVGAHAVAEVVAGIVPGSVHVAGIQAAGQPLKITAHKVDQKILLFYGVIGQIFIEQEAAYEKIRIRAYSLSWLLDLEKKSRSFQGETSIAGLIRKISEEQAFSPLYAAQDKTTEAPFVQYKETDWEFLNRLSTHLGVCLYAAGDYEGQGIYVGLQEQERDVKPEPLYEKWCMDEERLRTANFDMKKAVYYEILTGQIFHIGQGIRYKNGLVWPFSVDIVLRDGVIHCISKLAGKAYHTPDIAYNPHVKGISLTGRVLKREAELIKVHLDIDEEQEIGSAYYYSWMPEHGNMVYCMPEEGNVIRLARPGLDERGAMGVDCIRQNGNSCGETQITQNRWFSTAHDKKMTLQPSMMELTGKEGSSKILLTDSTGESIISDGNIVIQAGGTVVMQAAKMNLSAPGEITAVKRELGDPAVINLCYNLDAMGKQTVFHNLEKLSLKSVPKGGSGEESGSGSSFDEGEGEKEKREKLLFKMQELLEQEKEKTGYQLGGHIVNVITSIPQCAEQEELARVAMGLRPILGRMKGE